MFFLKGSLLPTIVVLYNLPPAHAFPPAHVGSWGSDCLILEYGCGGIPCEGSLSFFFFFF